MSFAVVRFLLGAVLLTAAALKAESLLMSPDWSFGLVLFELTFAAWLFSGQYPAFAWWAAAGCFGTFAMVAGFKVLHGDADCGCFGVVRTPPWVALLIDVTALVALLTTYYDRATTRTNRSTFISRLPKAAGYAVILLVAAKASLSLGFANGLTRDGASLTDPSRWVGQRFPLLEQIDIGKKLSSGECIVILHRHDCALCEETLNAPWFCDSAYGGGDSGQIALVELPPCGGNRNRDFPRSILVGQLKSPEPCLLPAPVVVLLEDGRVVSVATGRESEARLRELLGRWPKAVAARSWSVRANAQSMLALLEPSE